MAKEQLFAVFGLGSFGREVCRYFTENGATVIAFDNDPQLVERTKDEVRQAILLDSTDEEALSAGMLENVDAAVVAIGENIESSILTTALLKKIGVPRIIARAVNDLHLRVLRQIGADEVYNLEIEEGRRIAAQLLSGQLLDNIPISEDLSIVELFVPRGMVEQAPDAARERYGVNVIAVKRSHTSVDDMGNPIRRETVFLPRDQEKLRENDVILVVGRNADIDEMRE